MQSAKKLWLTRPVDDSEHLARDLRRHHIETLIAPVKAIVRQHFVRPSEAPDALLITSRHAAYALADFPPEWRDLPVYCVGQATAEYVKEYGYRHMIPGTSDILALLPRMAAELPSGGRIVYLAGEDRRVDVASLMAAREIEVTTLITYHATPETTLSPTLIDALREGTIGAVAFFSPRSAEVATNLLKRYALDTRAPYIDTFCFSLNVAKTAGHLPWKSLYTCHSPSRDAMIDLIVSKMGRA